MFKIFVYFLKINAIKEINNRFIPLLQEEGILGLIDNLIIKDIKINQKSKLIAFLINLVVANLASTQRDATIDVDKNIDDLDECSVGIKNSVKL